jgi:8-hydroxy-5-deazaflavin:NADPH oxidoreductase
MKVTILGTGSVGQIWATKLIELGHDVIMGTRVPADTLAKEKFAEWHKANSKVQLATFNEAAIHGEIIVNALLGAVTLDVFKSIDAANLEAKVIVDLSNPLDFSQGFPPTLLPSYNNTTSLAEELQKAIPNTKVIKALNTMWGGLMVNPAMIGNGDHNAFVAGNNADAKSVVKDLMTSFGWKQENILDLGDITKAKGVEMYLPLWLSIFGATNNGAFNIKIVS